MFTNNTPLPPKGKKNNRRLLDPIPTKEYKGERSADRTDIERLSKNSSQIRSQRANINRSVPSRTYGSEVPKGNPLSQRKRVYNEVTPELGAAIRLEIVKYPMHQREYVQGVAEVLEEVLLAAEKGLTQLPPRKKFGFHNYMNKAMLIKQQKEEENKNTEFKKQQQYEQHKQALHDKLSKMKEERNKEAEENKAKEREQKRRIKEKKQIAKAETDAERERIKKEIEAKRK